jgi:hypothetical protein
MSEQHKENTINWVETPLEKALAGEGARVIPTNVAPAPRPAPQPEPPPQEKSN